MTRVFYIISFSAFLCLFFTYVLHAEYYIGLPEINEVLYPLTRVSNAICMKEAQSIFKNFWLFPKMSYVLRLGYFYCEILIVKNIL